MLQEYIIAILWSLSPFGEAKVGIPYGMLQGLNVYIVLVTCLIANILIFPIMMFFLEKVNQYFLHWRFYKKSAIWVAKRAKKGTGSKVEKYGFWGILIFVMIPLPGTGVYAGSIASYLFNIDKKQAFLANTLGITLSCLIIWTTTFFSMGNSF